MHFSEIVKLQFGKKKHTKKPYIALYFTAFKNNCCSIMSKKKNAPLPPVFFLDSSNPY